MGKRLSEQTADNILSMIAIDKKYKPGEKLPNENELSEMLGVSRTTLREAVRILAAGQVVEIQRGRGTYVRPDFSDQSMDRLSDLATAKVGARDLYEMRLIFEPEAAYYAALRGTEAEMQKIFLLGEQIEQLIQDGKDRTKEEREFHKTIARATHNEFMNRLMPIIFAAIDKGVILSEAKKEAVEDTISDHRMLMQFLKNRNAEGARYAMKIHILHAIDQLDIKK
ncbi:MAG: FadR/GntR family transcriptional regulator [Lachnospiraceae bacterium]|nr:FadR/GntR family transcriptional regulator [Lachnospiraceae bacterium]